MNAVDVQSELRNSGFEPDEFDVGWRGGYRGTRRGSIGFAHCDHYCNVVIAHDMADGIAIEVYGTMGMDGQQLDKPEGCIVQLSDSATRYALAMYLLKSLYVSERL